MPRKKAEKKKEVQNYKFFKNIYEDGDYFAQKFGSYKDFNEIFEEYQTAENKYVKSKARDAIIVHLSGYVDYTIKRRYKEYWDKEREDLLEIGLGGVSSALDKYDPSLGAPSTFFDFYVTQEVQNYINAYHNNWTTHYQTNYNKIRKLESDFDKRGIFYNDIIISEVTNIPIPTLKTIKSIKHRTSVLEFNDGKDSNGNWLPATLELNEDVYNNPQKIVEETDLSNSCQNAMLSALNDREYECVSYRFGFYDGREYKIKEIAKKTKLSEVTVKHTIEGALTKLKHTQLQTFAGGRKTSITMLEDAEFCPASDVTIDKQEYLNPNDPEEVFFPTCTFEDVSA